MIPQRRTSRLVRGLLALLVLAAIIIGSPVLLLTIAGSPLPHGTPSLDQITATLGRRDDGTLFLQALRLLTWGAWAVVTLTTLVESAAQLRGRQAPQLPGLGSVQRLTAWLVTAVVLALGPGTPAMATGHAHAATLSTAAPHTTRPGTGAAGTGHVAGAALDQDAAPATPLGPRRQVPATRHGHTRIVTRDDTLWGIARSEYGRGERYHWIYRANHSRPQPPGLPRFTDPDLIYPGQRLWIPPAADATAPHTPTPPPTPPSTRPRATTPGKAPSKPSPAPSSTPIVTTPTAPPNSHPTQGASQPAQPPPRPSSPAISPRSSAPAAAPGSGDATQAPTPPAQTPQAPPTADGDHTVPASAIVGLSALAAAGVLALLASLRLIQQRRRRPGHRIAMPPVMSDSETQLRYTQDPASVDLLDTALRSLSTQLATTGQVLPAIWGARVTATDVELLLATDAAPIPPFTAHAPGPAGSTWRLDRRAELLPAQDAHQVPAPYPALVTLGTDADGAHILLDLETAGALTLTGGHGPASEVLTALALELATSPWADHIMVTCVAFGEDLPQVISTGRLRYTDTVTLALDDLQARARDVQAVLADAGAASVRHARTAQVGDDAWTPQIILSAVPFTPDEVDRLSHLVSGDAGGGLAAVLAASDPDAGPGTTLPGPWKLDASPGQQLHLDPLGIDVALQRVTTTQLQQLAADLEMAADPTSIPAWANVPAEPPAGPAASFRSTDQQTDARILSVFRGESDTDVRAAGIAPPPVTDRPGEAASAPEPDHDALDTVEAEEVEQDEEVVRLDPNAPEIRVLGRVEVAGRDISQIDPRRRNQLPELAAYLHLNPRRSAEEVSRALGGPRGPWSPKTRAANMSRLRSWFGRDAVGNLYVPTQGQGQLYTLVGVRCDWDRFQAIAQRGLARIAGNDTMRGIADLRTALDLVRGQPFASAGPASYIWAEHLKQEMISAIVDVVHALATTLIETGDPASARSIIAKGLDIEPGSELLYRDLFRAEHRAGNIAGIDAAAERLLRVLYELDMELEPETAELLERLRPHRRRSS